MKDWWKRLRYVLALLGLCAIATCPIAKRSCTQESRVREADQLLGYLGDRVAQAVSATGKVPPLAAGPTPKPGCCDQGGQCQPEQAQWETPAWRALAFSIDSPYRFTYEYLPDPSGTSAVVRATGDVACSGQISIFELKLVAKETGVERTWTRKDPSE